MEITSVNYQPIAYSYDRPSTYSGETGTPDGLWENADAYESSEITKVVHPANKDFYIGEYSQTSIKSMEERLAGWTKEWNGSPVVQVKNQTESKMHLFDLSKPLRTDFKLSDNDLIMNKNINNWLDGKGPLNSMAILHGTVRFDGFLLAPKDEARERLSNAKMGEEYNEALASLTPEDFYWSDLSGLQALNMDERAEFRTGLDTMLKDAGVDVNTSKLHFKFSVNGDMAKVQGMGMDKATTDSIMEIFNSSQHESEEIKNLANRLKELAKRNSEVNLELLEGVPGSEDFIKRHFSEGTPDPDNPIIKQFFYQNK